MMNDISLIDFSTTASLEKRGHIFVISGPSGVGKGTIVAELRKKHPEIFLSVSVTTRHPRPGEVHGVNYLFISKEEFEEMIKNNEFLEWADFAGNYYGTYASTVEMALVNGMDVALEIDVKGALQIREKLGEAVLIFILPPSMQELQLRLFRRKTESQEVIVKRLDIVKSEIERRIDFNYEIVNDNLEDAVEKLDAIISAERCRVIKNGFE
jgi:guanylate kinase